MVKRCQFCGKELVYLKKSTAGESTTWTSASYLVEGVIRSYKKCRCNEFSSVNPSAVLAFLSWLFFILTIIALISFLIPVNISFLEIWLFSTAKVILLPSAILFTVKAIRKSKITKQEKLLTSKKIWRCLYCQEDLEQTGDLDITTCQNCGNKIPICAMCNDSIFSEDKVYQLKPCNHLFHKVCMYEWIAENQKCPICEERIKEVSIDMSDIQAFISESES